MRAGPPIPVFVQRDVEESLAAEIAAGNWRGYAHPICYSFTWHPPFIGALSGHVHTGLELSLVLRGEIEVYYDAVTLQCGPGQAWLCGMWEPHAWRVNQEGTESISLIFLPDLTGDNMMDAPPYQELFALPPDRRSRPADSAQRERLLTLGREIRREMEQQASFWKTSVRLGLIRLLIEFCRASESDLSPDGKRPAAATQGSLARLMPALRLAHDSPRRRVSVAEAAAACAMSESRFGHLFQNATGISFAKFCLRARLMYAAHSLLSSDQTVEAVAAETGFVDISHLSRSFVRYFGCTPSQYRDHREQAVAGIPPRARPAGQVS
jgi:AraC-like DNA-binding protein